MKIRKLFIRNINSLLGDHRIDFTVAPLNESGLFAITGPTGSGKSTLLDALCLALYGKIPRLGDITKSTVSGQQALLTRHTSEARAEVEYECEKGVFRTWWQIQVNRNGNLNDYEMGVESVNRHEVIALKKSEVPDFNIRMTGLNFDQFSKAVLLAQGDFARFLKASKHERTLLLETITGAGIYRKLGQKAFEKGKVLAEELKSLESQLQLNQQGLLDESAYESDCREEVRNIQRQADLTQRTNTLREQLTLKEQNKVLEEALFQAEARNTQTGTDLQRFSLLYGESLGHYRKLIPLMNLIKEWQSATAMAREKEQMFGMTRNRLQTLHSQQETVVLECQSLLNKPLTYETAFQDIESWYQEWAGHKQKANDLRIEIKSLSQQAIQSLRELQIPYLNLKVQEINEKVLQHLDELQHEFERLKSLELTTDAEAESALKNAELLREHIQFRLVAEEKKFWFEEKIQQLFEKKSALEDKQQTLFEQQRTQQHELELVTVKAEAATRLYEQERVMASLLEHRHKLKPGEPCPLCGAMEHPFVEEYVDRRSERQKEYEALQVEKSRMQRQHAEGEAMNASYRQQIQQYEVELSETNKQFLQWKSDFAALNQEHQLPSDQDSLLALKNQTEVRIAGIREWRLTVQKAEKHRQLSERLQNMLLLDEQANQAEAALTSLTSLPDPTSEVKRLSQALNSLSKSLEAETERLTMEESRWLEAKKVLEEHEARLEAALKEQGFESREEASKSGINPQEYLKLDAEEKRLSEAFELSKAALQDLQQRKVEQLISLDPRPVAELKEELDTAVNTLQDYRERQLELHTKITQHREAALRVADIKEKLSALQRDGKQWVMLNQLIGDAQGAQFARFASELTLIQLLRLANVRLTLLNPRYSLDLPEDKEPEDLLVIIDHDMGDSRRSIKTLSGGEMFLLSLSLALGLSDMASSKVQIGSLFIDEGFGSLDPETLDQTLDILEKLQAESNRTIGIISHIDALKERIRVRIDLKRLGNGYSKVEVLEANAG